MIEVPIKELKFLDENMNWVVEKEPTELWLEIHRKIFLSSKILKLNN